MESSLFIAPELLPPSRSQASRVHLSLEKQRAADVVFDFSKTAGRRERSELAGCVHAGDWGKICSSLPRPSETGRLLSVSLLPAQQQGKTHQQDQFFKENVRFMAIPATQMRPGMIIKHNNDLHLVFTVEHRTPGNLRAFIQAKLRNIRTGAMFEHRFRSGDAIEKITVDEIPMEYLYQDGDTFCFMNIENYEQVHLNKDVLGDSVDYLTPNLQIKVEFYDGKAVGIELPQTVELTVVETEPGLKSATASSVTKPAKTETGLVVQVPPFINEGEKIRVDTAEGAYLSRA
jgi:elongation factor P